MEELEAKGVSIVIRTTTQETIQLLEQQEKLITKSISEFRIVTDMVRKNDNKINYYAGAELIKQLRDKGYQQEILIYCKDEKRAKENCIEKGVEIKNIIITKSESKLREFCKFE